MVAGEGALGTEAVALVVVFVRAWRVSGIGFLAVAVAVAVGRKIRGDGLLTWAVLYITDVGMRPGSGLQGCTVKKGL